MNQSTYLTPKQIKKNNSWISWVNKLNFLKGIHEEIKEQKEENDKKHDFIDGIVAPNT